MKHAPPPSQKQVAISLVALCLTLLLNSPSSAGPDSYQESQCGSQLKSISTALEVYSNEHQGHYPQALSQLVPRYLPSIPLCPSARKDTYSAGYQVGVDPDRYRVCCQGLYHFTENLPAYSSEGGLIRGAAAEAAAQNARPYYPNITAGLKTEGPSSGQLEDDLSDGVEAMEEHHYEKAEALFKKVVEASKPETPLAQKAHGALVLLYSLQERSADVDRELATLPKTVAADATCDVGADFWRSADQWTRLKDFKRAERLYHLALIQKATIQVLSRAHAQYAILLETQRRAPEALRQYQLALEGAMNWLSESKKAGDPTTIRVAGKELEYAGNLYANFLATHGRKAGAVKVKADINALLQ